MHPGAPPRPPLPPHRSTALRKPCIAAIAVVFYLGPAGHLRQIRRLQCLPELAEATTAPAVSSCAVSPSPFSRLHTAAATLPTTGARCRRPCCRRGHGLFRSRPSTALSSWGSQEAHAQLSLSKTPPGPRARYHPNSGAAASSVPASPGVPVASHLPHQMRESPGYAPVPSAAASVAFSASPARCRRHFGRRRRKSGDDDVGIISG